jgi:signal transduction histidine kinase
VRGLYVRASTLLFVAVLVATFLLKLIYIPGLREEGAAALTHIMRGPVLLLKERLDHVPDDEIRGELEKLERRFGYPLAVVSPDTAVGLMPGFDATAELAGAYFQDDTYFVLASIMQGERVLKIGPIPGAHPPGIEYMVAGFLSTAVVALVAAFFLVYPLTRRLSRLEVAARAISAGNFGARVPASGTGDAVGSLSAHFNAMAEHVEKHVEQQRELLQAVSHELRTPISRMGFSLELLAASHSPATREKHVRSIEQDIDELVELLEELVAYVRLEAGGPTGAPQGFFVHDAIEELAQRARRTTTSVELVLDVEASLEVPLERRKFQRAIGNLINNAVRYAQSRVEVQGRILGDTLYVDVLDDGPGVPVEARERVFRPFVTGEDSRSKESGGIGLGLPIVRRIVEQGGGEVYVTAAPGGGACFATRWPLERRTWSKVA